MNKIQQEVDIKLKEILNKKGLSKISNYVDQKTKILVRSEELNEEWYVSPATIKRGEIIPPSIRKRNAAERTKKIMDRKNKGVDYCINKIKEIHGEKYYLYNEESYKNLETDTEFFCNSCQKIFITKAKFLIKGHGCPRCALKNNHLKGSPKTTEDFKKDVLRLTGEDYIVLGEYIDQYTKIKMKHKCGYEYFITPKKFISGTRCRKCFEIKVNKTKEKFLDFLNKYEPDYELISDFKGAKKEIILRNNRTNEEFITTYQRFLAGVRSPKDATFGERIIRDFLKSSNLSFKHNYKEQRLKDKRPLEFDFKINNLNVFIEFNGIQHYDPLECFGGQEDFERRVLHDNMKIEFCKNNNYPFLVLTYKDKEEDIKQKLKEFLLENNLID